MSPGRSKNHLWVVYFGCALESGARSHLALPGVPCPVHHDLQWIHVPKAHFADLYSPSRISLLFRWKHLDVACGNSLQETADFLVGAPRTEQ